MSNHLGLIETWRWQTTNHVDLCSRDECFRSIVRFKGEIGGGSDSCWREQLNHPLAHRSLLFIGNPCWPQRNQECVSQVLELLIMPHNWIFSTEVRAVEAWMSPRPLSCFSYLQTFLWIGLIVLGVEAECCLASSVCLLLTRCCCYLSVKKKRKYTKYILLASSKFLPGPFTKQNLFCPVIYLISVWHRHQDSVPSG